MSIQIDRVAAPPAAMNLPDCVRLKDLLRTLDGKRLEKASSVRTLLPLNTALAMSEDDQDEYVQLMCDYPKSANAAHTSTVVGDCRQDGAAHTPTAEANGRVTSPGPVDEEHDSERGTYLWPADTPTVFLIVAAYGWAPGTADPGVMINEAERYRQEAMLAGALSQPEYAARVRFGQPAELSKAIWNAAYQQMSELVDLAGATGETLSLTMQTTPHGVHLSLDADQFEVHMVIPTDLREPGFIWSLAKEVGRHAAERQVKLHVGTGRTAVH